MSLWNRPEPRTNAIQPRLLRSGCSEFVSTSGSQSACHQKFSHRPTKGAGNSRTLLHSLNLEDASVTDGAVT